MKKRIISLLFISLLTLLISSVGLAENFDLKEIEPVDNLYIDVGGARITFDQNSDRIYLSEDLKVRYEDDDLYLSSPFKSGFFSVFNHNKFNIVIGTARDYSIIDIDAGGVNVTGVVSVDELYFDAGGMDIDLTVYGDKISADGGGINFNGYVNVRQLTLLGAGMKVDLDVEDIEQITLKGAGMDINFKYLDHWQGIRHLKMDGVGGNLRIMLPSQIKESGAGELDIDTNGIIDVDVDYYE